ncbi:agmatine deiminase family protein [Aliiroseovarius subalbicans]|uniref:agmatine deiminase family protein n=1 Tax=Aliiroseovarius subalbicans TaxID=2925840 RepID=UPI001F599E9C|nr:agmatine deiminase family protein [Aliiroseovarius subalbicans]MCI2399634.1 agmatine deiminase family protein [Aliiroseovarius subalbicans]
MRAEWLPHDKTWIAWPMSHLTFGDTLEQARVETAAVVHAIAGFEPITVVYDPDESEGVEALRDHDNVTLLELPIDDSWLRDSGPTFVNGPGGAVAGIDWTFNGWGGLFPADKDGAIAARILGAENLPRFASGMVFEGGAMNIDDAGTVLMTRQCFAHRTRNGGPDMAEFEAELHAQIGARRILWLERSMEGDSTNGHVDVVAAFTAPGQVVVQVSGDPNDPDYAHLERQRAYLEGETDADGRALTVHQIVGPPVTRRPDGTRIMLSYLNFYIVNGGVIVPQYGFADSDAAALVVLDALFPDRQVVGVTTPTIAAAGGNIHCITQQQPKGIV